MSWYVKKLMDNLPGITYTAEYCLTASEWHQKTSTKFINTGQLFDFPSLYADLYKNVRPSKWKNLYKWFTIQT